VAADAVDDADDNGADDVDGDTGGGGGGRLNAGSGSVADVAVTLAALRGGGKRLRDSGASSAPPAETSAATRYALEALRAAAAARIRARQRGWRLPVVVPNSGGAVVAVRAPADSHRHVERTAVGLSRSLKRSVAAIHAVRDGLQSLQAGLTRNQANGVAAVAAASVAAYALSTAPDAGVSAADRAVGALTASMLGVSSRQLRSVRWRLRQRGTAVPRQGAFVRAQLTDDASFVTALVRFMQGRYTSAELRALHLQGAVPPAARPAGASIRPNVADATSFVNWALQDEIALWRRRRAGREAAAAGGSGSDEGVADDEEGAMLAAAGLGADNKGADGDGAADDVKEDGDEEEEEEEEDDDDEEEDGEQDGESGVRARRGA
jgi:hypothetical protein